MHSADRPLIYYHLIENTNNNVFILIAVKIYFSFGACVMEKRFMLH